LVEVGGLCVTSAGNSSIPADYGLIDGVSVTETRELRARGSVVDSVIADAKSPVVYGYGNRLPVYFNQSPVMNVSRFGGLTGGGGSQGAPATPSRPSGRGTATDPDVPQGRPYEAPPPPTPPGQPSPEMLESLRNYLPTLAEQPRIVLKFGDEKELLISGMLAGGRELAGKPAVVDVPSGKGHYLLFAINPMWRQQTQGSFMLLLNAAMNFESLGVGRAAEKAAATQSAEDLQ